MTDHNQQPSHTPNELNGAANELGEVALPLREVDPKKVAIELTKQIKELKDSLAKIEESKTVRRETLDSEVSL
jgi:hypothetical protein